MREGEVPLICFPWLAFWLVGWLAPLHKECQSLFFLPHSLFLFFYFPSPPSASRFPFRREDGSGISLFFSFFPLPRRPCDPRFETINLHIWGHQNVAGLVHTLKPHSYAHRPSSIAMLRYVCALQKREAQSFASAPSQPRGR